MNTEEKHTALTLQEVIQADCANEASMKRWVRTLFKVMESMTTSRADIRKQATSLKQENERLREMVNKSGITLNAFLLKMPQHLVPDDYTKPLFKLLEDLAIVQSSKEETK